MRGTLVVGAFSPSVLLRTGRRLGLVDPGVREVPVASSPAQFAALLDGDIGAALTSPDNVIAYRFVPANPLGRTADVRIVSAVDRGLGLALYARPGLSTAAELAEALSGSAAGSPTGPSGGSPAGSAMGSAVSGAVGVDVPGSGFAFALYAALEAIGLRPGDYRTVALGSTPRRLEALLGGRCAATMLNAGADLRAQDAGAVRLAGVPRPYLGTVLCSLGPDPAVRDLAAALRATARAIVGGEADGVVTEEAAAALRLPPATAARYLQRLKDPGEGLVADGRADAASLSTVLGLRRRYGDAPGGDLLDQGLLDSPDSGEDRGR